MEMGCGLFMTETTTKELFWREVMAYRPMLMRAVAGILGEAEAKEVFRRLVRMEAVGAYLGDPKILDEFGAFLRGEGEDLGFYVLTLLDKGTTLKVRDSGLIMPLGSNIATRPFFFCWDEAIERCAARVSAYGLEQHYFYPWLHEFGHFLCYCLQERPLMAGIAILCSALKDRGYPIQVLREVEVTLDRQGDNTLGGLGRTLAQMAALNEAMAVWWEGQLLREMVLKAEDYLTAKVANNPYIGRLEAGGREESLEYIRHWDRAVYHPDPFSRAFAGSFRNMNMDRWGFLGAEGSSKLKAQNSKGEAQWEEGRVPGTDFRRLKDEGSSESGGQGSEVGGQTCPQRSRLRGGRGSGMTKGYLSGKKVAILGAGSVLGRNLALEAAAYGPKKLLLVSNDDNALISAYDDLVKKHPNVACEAVPVTISQPNFMAHFLEKHTPQILFHTETRKVLEFCENQPLDALEGNFVVTVRVAEMAEKAGVERFVFLSTLKAAQPKRYFSASYRLAELFLEEMARRSKTRFVSVRVGNVLDQETFLVRQLIRQFVQAGVVVLPLPDRKFWFLRADQAARLVIQAGGMGKGGEVFSVERGKQLSLRRVAWDFCLVQEFVPERDVTFVADPSGWDEWLLEDLTMEEGAWGEKEKATDIDGIWIVDDRSGGADPLRGVMEEVKRLVEEGDEEGMIRRLRRLTQIR